MRSHLMTLAVASLALAAVTSGVGAAEPRISGPFTHANLSLYLLHGPSDAGPVPLTLAEALEKGAVTVHETGDVNELAIENSSDQEIFLQSGDIVKGGQQDRVVMSSLMLAPKSGRVPLAAFCVEQGRWSARGGEDVATFAASVAALPSKEAKLAMKAPAKPEDGALGLGGTSERQQKVWESVAGIQAALSDKLAVAVASEESATSLQLALENQKLADEREHFVKALNDVGVVDDDVIGFAFAINGEINSADIYPSNGLFRKMWEKSLAAAVTEAIGKRGAAAVETAPEPVSVAAFIAGAGSGKPDAQKLSQGILLETRDGDVAYQFETRRADGGLVHRNILAK